MKIPSMQWTEYVFDELDNDVIRRLRNEEAYMILVQRRIETQSQYPFIRSIFEGDAKIFPSDKEYRAWLEVKRTLDDTERMERMAHYFQGHADCYAYFCKIGLL